MKEEKRPDLKEDLKTHRLPSEWMKKKDQKRIQKNNKEENANKEMKRKKKK
jgi:hypothetical protein